LLIKYLRGFIMKNVVKLCTLAILGLAFIISTSYASDNKTNEANTSEKSAIQKSINESNANQQDTILNEEINIPVKNLDVDLNDVKIDNEKIEEAIKKLSFSETPSLSNRDSKAKKEEKAR
jgi:signal transduction protein with GAF and PtsI domain